MAKKPEQIKSERSEPENITNSAGRKIDAEFLSQAIETFNAATEKLQASYGLLQEEARRLRQEVEDKNKKLTDVTTLLESILNNTRSAILVVNGNKIVIKNIPGDRLISYIGEERMHSILEQFPHEGVYDHLDSSDGGKEIYLRISVGKLAINNIDGAVYVLDDITNLKMMEKERNRSEKLKIMGEMAANIAHDIRNPLGSMELFTSLLDRELEEPEKKKLTANILKSIRIINGIISNTLLFAKEIQVHKGTYVLADIVDDVVLYLQHALREKKAVIINRLDESHLVCCDKDLFRQVVMNIVHNSVDAVDADNGKITLSSYIESGFLHFTVEDNGTGICDDMRSKLFMPFQTTKAKGTGLGLSIAYKIIKIHDGDIKISSDGKSYTKFDISLPSVKL